MAGCRDCSRCIETGLTSILFDIPRGIWWILTFWNIGLMQRHCPICGHKMAKHKVMADGRFAD